MNESVTQVFVEQPLASPGSTNYVSFLFVFRIKISSVPPNEGSLRAVKYEVKDP